MRIQATTRLLLLRHLLVGVLLLLPTVGSYVVYTAYSVSEQVQALTVRQTATAIEVPVAEPVNGVPTPEPAPVAVEQTAAPAPVTTAPKPVAATPAPAVDRLIIPSVGLNSQFVTVGLAGNGAVDVHPSLVGWWNGSAQPGSKGAAFFDGHTPGALTSLAGVGVGATISVPKANGQTLNYTVAYRETIPLSTVDMRKALKVYGSATEGLNLMTCAGTYIPSLGTTDQRLIVYAVRS